MESQTCPITGALSAPLLCRRGRGGSWRWTPMLGCCRNWEGPTCPSSCSRAPNPPCSAGPELAELLSCNRGRMQRAKIQFWKVLGGDEASQRCPKMPLSFPKCRSCDAEAERTPQARHNLLTSCHIPLRQPRPPRAPMSVRDGKILTDGAPPPSCSPPLLLHPQRGV